jgi:multidrug transporter EmrE-like cation transporter
MTHTLGIACALACALTTNLGFLYKHRGACAAPTVDFRRPFWSARQLFGSKLFTLGMIVACVSWIFHIGAMAMVPLSVVQAVLAGGVVMLAIMAERAFGLKIGPRQWMGLGMTAAGLVLLGISLPAVHGAHSRFSVPGMIAFEAVLIVLGALLIIGPRIGAPKHQHGVMLGGAAGILFGVSDVAIKALTGAVGAHGVMGLLSPWLAVTVPASVVAFYASAKSLQESEAVRGIAVTPTAANVSGILGGLLVFGDPLPSSAVGIIVETLAFALVLVAAWFTPAPARAVAVAA